MVLPIETWPSPPTQTWPLRRTVRMVVPSNCCKALLQTRCAAPARPWCEALDVDSVRRFKVLRSLGFGAAPPLWPILAARRGSAACAGAQLGLDKLNDAQLTLIKHRSVV